LGAIIEIRHLATKLLDVRACTVCWPAVLLKLELVHRLWLYKEYCTRVVGNLLKYTCTENEGIYFSLTQCFSVISKHITVSHIRYCEKRNSFGLHFVADSVGLTPNHCDVMLQRYQIWWNNAK